MFPMFTVKKSHYEAFLKTEALSFFFCKNRKQHLVCLCVKVRRLG